MNKKAILAVRVAVLTAAALPFTAAAESYVGATMGQARWPHSACVTGYSCDRNDTAWTIRAGYSFLPLVGIEARYFDLGRVKSAGGFQARGEGVGATIALPIAPLFALTGTAGVSRVRTSMDQVTTQTTVPGGTVISVSGGGTDTSSQPYYGAGIRFTFAPGLDASVEANRHRVKFGGTANIDTLGVGLNFRF